MPLVLLCHSLPYLLDKGSLTEPGARLTPRKSQRSSCLCSSQHQGYSCGRSCAPFLTWMLGMEIQVLLLTKQALLPTESSG